MKNATKSKGGRPSMGSDGRRDHVTIRLSENELARIDKLRKATSDQYGKPMGRPSWCYAAVLLIIEMGERVKSDPVDPNYYRVGGTD